MAEHFTNSRLFRTYTQALARRHTLLCLGKESDQAIDEAEDRMARVWPMLTEVQKKEARGIGSDLNWLERGYTPPPKGRKKADVSQAELEEYDRLLAAAHTDSDLVLPLLHAVRACASTLTPEAIALVRARCYSGLGLNEIAEPFLKATIELMRDHSMPCRAAFVMLVHVSSSGAFDKAVDVTNSHANYPPVVVAYAFHYFTRFLGAGADSVPINRIAEALHKAAKRLDDEPTPDDDRVTFYGLAGDLLTSFGHADAVWFLEEGLKLSPKDAEMLGALGESLYRNNRARAVECFKQAILAQSKDVRPWLYLANDFLIEGDFERARAYAAQAAERARDGNSMGFALEVMAIGMSELGESPVMVLGLLRRAHELAPTNRRIALNLESYDRYVQKKANRGAWETDDPPVVQGIGGRLRDYEPLLN